MVYSYGWSFEPDQFYVCVSRIETWFVYKSDEHARTIFYKTKSLIVFHNLSTIVRPCAGTWSFEPDREMIRNSFFLSVKRL